MVTRIELLSKRLGRQNPGHIQKAGSHTAKPPVRQNEKMADKGILGIENDETNHTGGGFFGHHGGSIPQGIFQRVRVMSRSQKPGEIAEAGMVHIGNGLAVCPGVRPDCPTGTDMCLKCHAGRVGQFLGHVNRLTADRATGLLLRKPVFGCLDTDWFGR